MVCLGESPPPPPPQTHKHTNTPPVRSLVCHGFRTAVVAQFTGRLAEPVHLIATEML